MSDTVEIEIPDISPFARGNTDIPYATTIDAGRSGPNVVITALVHGNELSGAHALIRLFETEIRPHRGSLTLIFANVEAFHEFDLSRPRATRFLDEDLNRVWLEDRLDGDGHTRELDRARQMRPLIERADALLDLHSMQRQSRPLILSGTAEKGRKLAQKMNVPPVIVADTGHRFGRRLRDFGAFADPASPKTAVLVESGQHWKRSSIGVAIASCRAFLAALDVVDAEALDALGPLPDLGPALEIEVSDTVTVEHGPFRFVEDFTGLEVIASAGTTIAHDGDVPVRTPYDHCVLVMPVQRLAPGLTAVRLGRVVGPA